jgi:hypothetical protein
MDKLTAHKMMIIYAEGSDPKKLAIELRNSLNVKFVLSSTERLMIKQI